jgi:hypothetical protein
MAALSPALTPQTSPEKEYTRGRGSSSFGVGVGVGGGGGGVHDVIDVGEGITELFVEPDSILFEPFSTSTSTTPKPTTTTIAIGSSTVVNTATVTVGEWVATADTDAATIESSSTLDLQQSQSIEAKTASSTAKSESSLPTSTSSLAASSSFVTSSSTSQRKKKQKRRSNAIGVSTVATATRTLAKSVTFDDTVSRAVSVFYLYLCFFFGLTLIVLLLTRHCFISCTHLRYAILFDSSLIQPQSTIDDVLRDGARDAALPSLAAFVSEVNTVGNARANYALFCNACSYATLETRWRSNTFALIHFFTCVLSHSLSFWFYSKLRLRLL